MIGRRSKDLLLILKLKHLQGDLRASFCQPHVPKAERSLAACRVDAFLSK